ncbi:MAG: hypothetical protein AAFR59_18555, partial [Bacteroidota bacterium]
PFYPLHAHSPTDQLVAESSDVILIDSIHHLSFGKRLQLFRKKKVLIFTTHFDRKWECLLVGQKLVSYRFRGLSAEVLHEIVSKRLALASLDATGQSAVDPQHLARLHKKYGDNLRGILNHLYQEFQNL